MKGVILAGGLGTRLHPLTLITNKHLLPVYDRPMILYPLETLKRAGIVDIMIVCGKEHGGHFMTYLGSGKDHGVKLQYALQHGSGGIADALRLAETFVGNDKVAVVLGDNIFEDDFSGEIRKFEKMSGAMIFLKSVKNPQRFGVAVLEKGKIKEIEEKPKTPKSDLAVVGFYLYDVDVLKKIGKLNPSGRGELEITDIQNMYLVENKLSHSLLKGFWSDAGTFESLLNAAAWAAKKLNR